MENKEERERPDQDVYICENCKQIVFVNPGDPASCPEGCNAMKFGGRATPEQQDKLIEKVTGDE